MEQIELKFKGWDKVKKRMYLWEHFNGIGHFFGDTSPVTDYGDDRISEDFIVLRYTGLKDKNEKEIYEGDIVAFYGYKNGYYDEESEKWVEYKTPQYGIIAKIVIQWHEHEYIYGGGYDKIIYGGYMIPNIEYTHRPDINTCEVIGNVFENPELEK